MISFCVGCESLVWFLSVSGYLQNNSWSFADILASRGGGGRRRGDSVSGSGSGIVTESGSKLLSEQLRGERAGVWHECILYRNIKDFVWIT